MTKQPGAWNQQGPFSPGPLQHSAPQRCSAANHPSASHQLSQTGIAALRFSNFWPPNCAFTLWELLIPLAWVY
ncbi:hypothetical protein BKA56DRAFT_581990 [Ilyonectria sp. MPI-CAGE-AT-0026]|nr:hypothetical protein BKA56DRAFT_581990 [Ilyonectria sp. MPI-CAGE-AT-0026]